jgi:hypothetical protein
MSSGPEQKTEEIDKKPIDLQPTDSQPKTIEHTEPETENLKNLRKLRHPSLAGKISIVLLIPGVLALIASILNQSQVLAFIGLGLTFWGAVFLLVRPTTYVQGSLLDATAISLYTTIDRMTNDLKCRGKSFYIPPYPKQAYLPEHLKGLKEMIVFISADESTSVPSIEEMAESKFMLRNPKGVSITPPGSGLLDQFQTELKLDPTQIDLETLCETLPNLILENFQLAKEIEMKPETDQVNTKISGSIFKSLYLEKGLTSVHSLGCPLVSAIACAVAKTTGKAITINSLKLDQEKDTIEVSYLIMKD